MKKLMNINEMWEKLEEKSYSNKIFFQSSKKLSEIIYKLIDTRRNNNLSQRQLADILNMKQSALARIETLKVIPKLDTILKIAESLNIEIKAFNKEEYSNFKPLNHINLKQNSANEKQLEMPKISVSITTDEAYHLDINKVYVQKGICYESI